MIRCGDPLQEKRIGEEEENEGVEFLIVIERLIQNKRLIVLYTFDTSLYLYALNANSH